MVTKLKIILLLVISISMSISMNVGPYAYAKFSIPENDENRLKTYGKSQRLQLSTGVELSLLSWNIYKGGKKSFKQDYQNISRDIDFILLQEMTSKSDVFKHVIKGPNEEDESDEYEYQFAISFTGGWIKSHDHAGIGTYSKYQAQEVHTLTGPHREPFSKTPKMSLVTKYQIQDGGELLIVNIHSLNFVRLAKWNAQLTEMMKIIETHTGPVILAGDFNTWSKKKLDYLYYKTRKLNLIPLFQKNKSEGRTTFMGKPLDHIFYRDLKYIEHTVLRDSRGSDHVPIILKFML